MTVQVLGCIKLKDGSAFAIYRSKVGATIEQFGGKVVFRGELADVFWNDLNCGGFDCFVQIEFPDLLSAKNWAISAEYATLLEVRHRAMDLTLFTVQ